jgi:hypothetical protein
MHASSRKSLCKRQECMQVEEINGVDTSARACVRNACKRQKLASDMKACML